MTKRMPQTEELTEHRDGVVRRPGPAGWQRFWRTFRHRRAVRRATTNPIDLRPSRISTLIKHWFLSNPIGQFAGNIASLIWQYRIYSLAILVMTVFQEFAAIWPVNLLGQFIDRLASGDLGNTVWLLLLASLFYPALARANVMLRHTMFYKTDFQKMVELVLEASNRGDCATAEEAGSAYGRLSNAVAGITNATFHTLGSFTPVIIKTAIVCANLLGYNRTLGLVYVASLSIPIVMTLVFNKWLRALRDSQYSIGGQLPGTAIRTISERDNQEVRARFRQIMEASRRVFTTLIYRHQSFLYVREAALVGSQFIVIAIALAMRERIGTTPGDFARIIGYTTQVAAAFINTASCLDAVISHSRAYSVYARAAAIPPRETPATQS